MKKCPYCKVEVGGNPEKCPLCQSKLMGEGDRAYFPVQDTMKFRSWARASASLTVPERRLPRAIPMLRAS